LWNVLFPVTACIGIISIFFQKRLRLPDSDIDDQIVIKKSSWTNILIMPWKDSLDIVRKDVDFRTFQFGFMLCGFALMLIMPVLPIFFVDVLGISYTDFAIAIGICKGLGFAISSLFWPKMTNIFKILSLIMLFFAFFAMLMLASQYNIILFYLGYLVYGVAQGGSDLYWNLSGPIFSRDKDSSLYSGVNVVCVGIRGCIGPPLGIILTTFFGPSFILMLSAALSIYAGIKMLNYQPKRSCKQ
jgi:hypothetical protein